MVPTPTRRALLRTGLVGASASLAGCSALTGDSEPDPDAGKDSYGVLLENRLDDAYTVTLTGETFRDHEQMWRKEGVEIAAGESREWEQVFTEPTHYLLRARAEDDDFPETYRAEHNSVNVGKESSPDAENALVTLRLLPGTDDEEIPAVWVQPPGRGT
jgi:hypothetical protein